MTWGKTLRALGDDLIDEEIAHFAPEAERIYAEWEARKRWRESERKESQRLFKAFMLAKTVDDCQKLLEGKPVPADRLDPHWVQKFRMGHAANR